MSEVENLPVPEQALRLFRQFGAAEALRQAEERLLNAAFLSLPFSTGYWAEVASALEQLGRV